MCGNFYRSLKKKREHLQNNVCKLQNQMWSQSSAVEKSFSELKQINPQSATESINVDIQEIDLSYYIGKTSRSANAEALDFCNSARNQNYVPINNLQSKSNILLNVDGIDNNMDDGKYNNIKIKPFY